MRQIVLDAGGWRTVADGWDALLAALEAPGWHGRNLDALADSLSGGVNGVAPPFALCLTGTAALPPDVAAWLDRVAEVFAEAGPAVRLLRA
ncbi:MAG TPA: barstar family protein [Paracoccaceae bacterium]|nr:barstar family protein [Paracoccaceae bacterium]